MLDGKLRSFSGAAKSVWLRGLSSSAETKRSQNALANLTSAFLSNQVLPAVSQPSRSTVCTSLPLPQGQGRCGRPLRRRGGRYRRRAWRSRTGKSRNGAGEVFQPAGAVPRVPCPSGHVSPCSRAAASVAPVSTISGTGARRATRLLPSSSSLSNQSSAAVSTACSRRGTTARSRWGVVVVVFRVR